MFSGTQNRSVVFNQSSVEAIEYNGNTCITLVTTDGKRTPFSTLGKQHFFNNTGEHVIEVSGLTTGGKQDISWAIARFDLNGCSLAHYHRERTEVIYVMTGTAKLILDEGTHILKEGDSITIKPNQMHQMFNADANKKLEVVISCTPAWKASDYLIKENSRTPTFSRR